MNNMNRVRQAAGLPLIEEYSDNMTIEDLQDINRAVSKAVDALMSREGMDQGEATGHVIQYIQDVVMADIT